MIRDREQLDYWIKQLQIIRSLDGDKGNHLFANTANHSLLWLLKELRDSSDPIETGSGLSHVTNSYDKVAPGIDGANYSSNPKDDPYYHWIQDNHDHLRVLYEARGTFKFHVQVNSGSALGQYIPEISTALNTLLETKYA